MHTRARRTRGRRRARTHLTACSYAPQKLLRNMGLIENETNQLLCFNASSSDRKGIHSAAALVTQEPNATFFYAPTIAMRCYETIPKTMWVQAAVQPAHPTFESQLPRRFHGIPDFCASFAKVKWPTCPQPISALNVTDMFFGVMTARRFLASRGRVVSRTLALQGARHGIFGEFELHSETRGFVTGLPEAARLELWNGTGRRPPFIAQKYSSS